MSCCCATRRRAAEEEEEAENEDEAAPTREEERDANNNSNNNPTSSHGCWQSSLRFWKTFFAANGPLSILILSTLIAFSLGSVVGVIPDVVADRYARIRHDYHGAGCATFDRSEKPTACQQGADDAQAAAAASTLALNLLTLVFNPVVGSLSDVKGRRGMILISLGLYSIGAFVFCLLQWIPWLSPNVYYVAVSLSGAVDFLSMSFAATADVLPEPLRAAGYGVLLAGYYSGFSLAPSIPLVLSHFHTSLFSCTAAFTALLLAALTLPETLPEAIAAENRQQQQQQQQQQHDNSFTDEEYIGNSNNNNPQVTSETPHWLRKLSFTVSRPIRDMAILTRGNLPILAAASFFSAMVYSSDKTFVIYYIEDQLNVRDGDIAKMFLIFGPVGVIIQAFLIQPLLKIIGEKELLIIAFLSGTCHNALYGLAKTKSTILVALCLSQLTKVNFPILSSYASRNASANEQGRVQGALFALNALANAIGPMLLEIVYDKTKNTHAGTMFLCASMLYGVGTFLVSWLPRVDATATATATANNNTGEEEDGSTEHSNHALEEPLLVSSNSTSTGADE